MVLPLDFLLQVEQNLHHCQVVVFSLYLLKLWTNLVQQLIDELHLFRNLQAYLIVVEHPFTRWFLCLLVNMMTRNYFPYWSLLVQSGKWWTFHCSTLDFLIYWSQLWWHCWHLCLFSSNCAVLFTVNFISFYEQYTYFISAQSFSHTILKYQSIY